MSDISTGMSRNELMEMYMGMDKKFLCELLIDVNGKLSAMGNPVIVAEETVQPEPKKRYFIVFYKIFSDMEVMNDCDVVTDGEYVNKKEIATKVLAEWNKKYNGTVIFRSVFINDIIELNESDYKDWVK